MSGRPKRIRVGSVTAGAQTYSPAQVGGGPIPEWQIQDAGERAIAHHFGCPRSAPLHYVLVSGAINYRCWGCDARASVGPDGQPVGSPGEPPIGATPTAGRRRAGRPGWSVGLFADRLAEAKARGGLLDDAPLRRVADFFQTLDGTIGETTGDYLGKLDRRLRPK